MKNNFMLDIKVLKNDIIIPVLSLLNMNSESAVNLLLGTCAQESILGTYNHQINGPALGIFQIEPTTYKLVLKWISNNKPNLVDIVGSLKDAKLSGLDNLQFNNKYSTAIARCLYASIPVKLPPSNDVESLGKYWKDYYNRGGRGTVEEFVKNFNILVLPNL
jgi:hypothetical protein